MQLAPNRRPRWLMCVGVVTVSFSVLHAWAQVQTSSPQPSATQVCPCSKPTVKKKRTVHRKRRKTTPAAVSPSAPATPAQTEKPAGPPAPVVQIAPYPTTPAAVAEPQSHTLPVPVHQTEQPNSSAQLPAPKLPRPEPVSSDEIKKPGWMMTKDGVPRINLEFGGGVALPISQAHNSQNNAGVIEGAVGYNFSRFFTLQARGEYNRASVPASVLVSQNQAKGRVEMGSATVNMIIRYAVIGRLGAYISGGGGYYRRITKFLQPTTNGSQTIDNVTAEYSMNTAGAAFGAGFEWRVWSRTGMKVFAEARYNYVEGQDQTGSTTYQLNSRTTEYAPMLIGVRW